MEKLAMLATLPWEQLEGPRWGTASYKGISAQPGSYFSVSLWPGCSSSPLS